jgi:hypothetical protein
MKNTKTDHTAAIFAALGVRIGTHPNWFKVTPPNHNNLWEPKYKLTESCIESDGLAVRLLELARGKVGVVGLSDLGWTIHIERYGKYTFMDKMPLAAAVHDALVEALGVWDVNP